MRYMPYPKTSTRGCFKMLSRKSNIYSYFKQCVVDETLKILYNVLKAK